MRLLLFLLFRDQAICPRSQHRSSTDLWILSMQRTSVKKGFLEVGKSSAQEGREKENKLHCKNLGDEIFPERLLLFGSLGKYMCV